jgi:hypothetical protein
MLCICKMNIQTVLFNSDKYTLKDIDKWFKENDLSYISIFPIVNTTTTTKEYLWRVRLYNPNKKYFDYTRVIINDDISFMIQTPKN